LAPAPAANQHGVPLTVGGMAASEYAGAAVQSGAAPVPSPMGMVRQQMQTCQIASASAGMHRALTAGATAGGTTPVAPMSGDPFSPGRMSPACMPAAPRCRPQPPSCMQPPNSLQSGQAGLAGRHPHFPMSSVPMSMSTSFPQGPTTVLGHAGISHSPPNMSPRFSSAPTAFHEQRAHPALPAFMQQAGGGAPGGAAAQAPTHALGPPMMLPSSPSHAMRPMPPAASTAAPPMPAPPPTVLSTLPALDSSIAALTKQHHRKEEVMASFLPMGIGS